MSEQSKAERKSEREFVVSRTVNGTADQVFNAWAKSELFQQWWVPEGAPMTLIACEMDVRVGGGYRLVFKVGDQEMAFFGKYLEVKPGSRLVWTNEEGGADAAVITTVTFAETGTRTLVNVHDQYPSKEALDAAIEDDSTSGLPVQLAQLDEMLKRS